MSPLWILTMTDDSTNDDGEVSDSEMARTKTREVLDHIESMNDGFWGLVALVVGLVLKAVLWKVSRETSESETEEVSDDE